MWEVSLRTSKWWQEGYKFSRFRITTLSYGYPFLPRYRNRRGHLPRKGHPRGGAMSGVIPSIVLTVADRQLEVFIQGTDDALWHTWQTAGEGASGSEVRLAASSNSGLCVRLDEQHLAPF